MDASVTERSGLTAVEAHYFHKSLYCFDGVARREVIQRFNTAVSDISAKCWYLADKDMFELKCPNSVGYLRDETLGQIISAYIEEELAAADDDERPPHVVRFPDSNLDEFTFADADDAGTFHDEEPANTQPSPQSAVEMPACNTLHVVGTDESKIKVKLLRLHELPAGQVQRVLARHSDANVRSMCMSGVTVCAVKVAQGGQYVFNGRIGQPLPQLDAEEKKDFMTQVPFRSIHGTAHHPEPEPAVRQWRIKDGASITVKQWLSGVGETEEYDARKEPEIRDEPARHPVEQPSAMQLAFERHLEGDGDDSESSSDAPAAAQTASKPGFAALLRRQSSEDGCSDSSDNGCAFPLAIKPRSSPEKQTFASLLLATPAVVAPSQSRERDPLTSYDTCSPNRLSERTQSTSIAGTVFQTQTTSTKGSSEQTDVPSHGKGFAAVNTVGLNANASSQASWEMLYAEPRRKQARSGLHLAARHSSEVSNDSTPTMSDFGHGASPLRAFMATESAGIDRSLVTVRQVSDAEVGGDEPSWVNRVVPPSAPERRLIDDTAAESLFVKRPPGLGLPTEIRPPPGLHPPVPSTEPEGSPVRPLEDDLISILSEDRGESRQIRPPPGLTSRLLQPAHVSATFTQTVSETNDGIAERLQSPIGRTPEKKYTMRQKAGKKKQKAKGPASKPAVQLPKPDLPPLPQKKKKKETSQQSQDQKTSTGESAVVANASLAGREAKDRKEQTTTETAHQSGDKGETQSRVHPLLSITRQPRQSRTRVDIGKVIIQYEDPKDLRRKVLLADEALKLPIKATTFLDRLTTSASDASYILDLAKAADQPSVETAKDQESVAFYEWHLTNTSNQSFVVNTYDNHRFEIRSAWVTVVQIFEHFPRHVWDARWQTEALNIDVDETPIRKMINTIATGKQLPSLFAPVPVDMIPSRILAKREYRRQHVPGVVLVVTEVQDLQLESVSGVACNLKAWAASEEAMIKEDRLWWEARLDIDNGLLLANAELVEEIVKHYVTQMDGVGFNNKGPWVWQDVPKTNEVQEVPFW